MKMNLGMILWLAICFFFCLIKEERVSRCPQPHTICEHLLSLWLPAKSANFHLDVLDDYPEMKNNGKRGRMEGWTNIKKRGSRGVRERLRRCSCKHLLLVITLSNKMNELMVKVQHDSYYRQSNLICLTESWLKEGMSDPNLPSYTLRADRENSKSQKSFSGGVCIYVDDRWAMQYNIQEKVCTRDYEILVVLFQTFYLPREFFQIALICLCTGARFWGGGNQDCTKLQ